MLTVSVVGFFILTHFNAPWYYYGLGAVAMVIDLVGPTTIMALLSD